MHKCYPIAQDLGTRAWDKIQGMILCQGTCPGEAELEPMSWDVSTWHLLLSRMEGSNTPGTGPGLGQKEKSWQT